MWCLWCRDGCRWGVRLNLKEAALSASPGGAARPRILLVAPHQSYRISAYQTAAGALGARLVIASQGQHSLIPEVADGLHVDFARVPEAVERILAHASREPFDAVVASDDLTLEVATRAAAALGLPHNPLSAVCAARRKDLARDVLRMAGLPVPQFRCLNLTQPLTPQTAGLHYPCVIKPLAMSASRGVIRVDSSDGLRRMLPRVAAIVADALVSDERDRVLVESFLPGTEIAVEGLLSDGRLHVLAVFDKPDPDRKSVV